MQGVLQIELTNKCNLDCIYCPRPSLIRTKQSMDLKVFRKILHTFGDDADTIGLSKDGEPLLHPQFSAFVQELSSIYDRKIDIYTNGTLLTEDIMDALGGISNPTRVLVTEHHYGRKKSQSELALTTRKNLRKALAKNYSNLTFTVTLHCPPADIEMLNTDEWAHEWKEVQVQHSNLVGVHINRLIHPWLGFIKCSGRDHISTCPYTDTNIPQIFFGVTGNLLACCVDLNEELVLGNIFTHTKNELLVNLNNIRDRLRTWDLKGLVPCDRCLGWTGKNWS